jgi:hypothetical protein
MPLKFQQDDLKSPIFNYGFYTPSSHPLLQPNFCNERQSEIKISLIACRDILFGTETRLLARRPRNRCSIPGTDKNFSLL